MRARRWQRWFLALKPGDTVLIRFPWDDRHRPGGRIVKARVTRCPNTEVKVFLFRNRAGDRFSHSFTSWVGDCYHTIMPLDHEVVYSPKRGYLMRKRKLGWHRQPVV